MAGHSYYQAEAQDFCQQSSDRILGELVRCHPYNLTEI